MAENAAIFVRRMDEVVTDEVVFILAAVVTLRDSNLTDEMFSIA